jgi:hypothetical protein
VSLLTRPREVYRLLSEEEYRATRGWVEQAGATPHASHAHGAKRCASSSKPASSLSATWLLRRGNQAALVAAGLLLSAAAVLTFLAFRGLRRDLSRRRDTPTRSPRNLGTHVHATPTLVGFRVSPRPRRQPARPARPRLRLVAAPAQRVRQLAGDTPPAAAPRVSDKQIAPAADTSTSEAEFGFER